MPASRRSPSGPAHSPLPVRYESDLDEGWFDEPTPVVETRPHLEVIDGGKSLRSKKRLGATVSGEIEVPIRPSSANLAPLPTMEVADSFAEGAELWFGAGVTGMEWVQPPPGRLRPATVPPRCVPDEPSAPAGDFARVSPPPVPVDARIPRRDPTEPFSELESAFFEQGELIDTLEVDPLPPPPGSLWRRVTRWLR